MRRSLALCRGAFLAALLLLQPRREAWKRRFQPMLWLPRFPCRVHLHPLRPKPMRLRGLIWLRSSD